ncbi:membrane bound O-acyl transferase family-domain-containing protein [Schizophyllum fasciatum]
MDSSNGPGAAIVPMLLVFAPIPVVIATRPPTVVRLLLLGAQLQLAYTAVTRNPFLLGDPYHGYVAADTIGIFSSPRYTGEARPPQELPLLRRVWWATLLVGAVRGAGWNNTVANIPKVPKHETRRSFVMKRLADAVVFVFVMDIAGIYLTHNPITSTRAAEHIAPSSQGPVFRILSSFLYMGNFWADSQLQYCILSALVVGCGADEPQSWPPLWGTFWDAFTVRRLWGRTWHLCMRRFISSISKTTARLLGARPGTFASSYIQLYAGFFVSVLVHAFGDLNINNRFGTSFVFFMGQAVIITVEDFVIALARKAGVRASAATRTLGRLYVLAWLCVSLPVLTDPILSSGRPLVASLPFSVVEALWRAAGMEGKWALSFPEPV